MTNSFWPSSESWQRYWSPGIIASIGVIQLFCSFAIMGIHAAIVVIGVLVFCIGAAPWYIMGFVCWAFFLACWISIFCVTCCNRSSVGCATYVMIKNILAFIFSCVLIDFDRKFIDGSGLQDLYSYYIGYCDSSYLSSSGTDFWYITLSLAKGQLAGAVVILVSSLIFIGIYIYVYIRALGDDQRIFNNGGSYIPNPNTERVDPQTIVYQAQSREFSPNTVYFNDDPKTIVCHRCGAAVATSQRF